MPPVMVLVRALAPLLFSTGLASGSALVELTDSTFEVVFHSLQTPGEHAFR